jgi:LysM repeat protein
VAGDTLETIATAHNTTTERIQALNPGLNPNLLPGTVLVLP